MHGFIGGANNKVHLHSMTSSYIHILYTHTTRKERKGDPEKGFSQC